jgi:putative oxidoreductase
VTRSFTGLSEYLYGVMRIVFGFLFLFHGTQKLFAWPSGTVQPLMSLAGLAGVIELIGGTLVAIGLFASPAAFIASGEMAVAYFLRHQPQGFWPIQNRGELAVLYCFAFLYIAAKGNGRLSVGR